MSTARSHFLSERGGKKWPEPVFLRLDPGLKLKSNLSCVILFSEKKMNEDQIKEVLLREDQAFSRLYEQHQEIEQSLSNLQAKGFLTASEELAEKELKKRKLRLKDELYRRIIEYKEKMRSHE
jgi:uncharacterized protein YdcH (DUF465 family)